MTTWLHNITKPNSSTVLCIKTRVLPNYSHYQSLVTNVYHRYHIVLDIFDLDMLACCSLKACSHRDTTELKWINWQPASNSEHVQN